MAFNPLRSFRRNQKTLLAGLTIMCMFIFVLQFSAGGGDFFDQVTNWVGFAGRSQHAGTLYGHVVTGRDVDLVQTQRQLANEYMLTANRLAQGLLMQGQIKQMSELMGTVPQMAQVFQMRDPRQRIEFLTMMASRMTQEKKEKEAAQLKALIDIEIKMAQLPQLRPDMPYFANSLNSIDELFMFKIWLHQADQLGINLSREDVTNLVLLDTQYSLPVDGPNSLIAIRNSLFAGRSRMADVDTLMRGLTNEYRVRLARATLLGYDLYPFVVTPGITPYELWQDFNKQRTANSVAVLPIAVDQADFLAKVGEPKDEDLHKLFEKGKDREPDAGSPEPGFKQPGRIEVAWVHGDPEDPYYRAEGKKLAAAYAEGLKYGQQVLTGGLLADGGLGAAAVTAATLAPALDQDLIALSKYSWMVVDRPIWHRNPTYFAETSHAHPANVRLAAAALIGEAGGASSSLAAAFTAPAAYQATTAVREMDGSVRVLSTMFLTGAAGMPIASYAQAAAVTPEKEFRPYEQMRAEVLDKLAQDLAVGLVLNNLDKVHELVTFYGAGSPEALREKLKVTEPAVPMSLIGLTLGDALTGAPGLQTLVASRLQERADALGNNARLASFLAFGHSPLAAAATIYQREHINREQVDKYLAAAVTRYHLQLGGSEQPRDKYHFLEDPGIKQLRAALPVDDQQFVNQFFPEFFPGGNAVYTPHRMGNNYISWKSVDWPAYVPTFDEARSRVIHRWKVEQARKLAKAEAEEVAERARKAKGDALRVLKDGSKHSGKEFNLYEISPITKNSGLGAMQMRMPTFQDFAIDKAYIKYPTDKMREQLLAMREPGEVVVLADNPEGTYYVMAMIERRKASEKEFYQDYKNHGPELIGIIERENHVRRDYVMSIEKRLQDEARMTIDPEFRKSMEKRREE